MFRTFHAITFWTLVNIGIAVVAGGAYFSDCEGDDDPGEGEGEPIEGEGEGEGETMEVTVTPVLPAPQPKAEVHRYMGMGHDCGHAFGRSNCIRDCFPY